MAIDITNLGRVNNYFKSVSGFVPNKYLISINGDENLSFYAKNVSLPQIKINTINDIYVSEKTLGRPKLPISAESVGEISITFRDDNRLSIYNKLVNYHRGVIGDNYEATGNFEDIKISIKVYSDSSVVFNKTYNKCSLFDIVSLKVDSGSRKFLEYEATFVCNDLLDSLEYDTPSSIGEGINAATIDSCADLKKKYKEAVLKFKTYKVDSRYITPGSVKNELGANFDANSRRNADIQIEKFIQYMQPAILAFRNNSNCAIPPITPFEGVFPGENTYVVEGLKDRGFRFV